MIKHLRFLLMGMMVMLTSSVMADTTVTFTLNDPQAIEALGITLPASGEGTKVESIVKDGVTIAATTAEGKTDTRIYQGSGNNEGKYDFRIYADGTLTFTAGNYHVKKIVITGKNVLKLSGDGYEGTNTEATWAGSSTSVMLTATGTATIYTIAVTYGVASSVGVPYFSLPSGTYTEPQTVALSCDTEGARILYTLPIGEDPVYFDDENYVGVFYDGNPLQITQNTIIKAIAVKDGEVSAMVTATYNFASYQGEGTLENPFTAADARALASTLADKEETTQDYYIKGKISSIKNTFNSSYGTAIFNISDDGTTDSEFTCYGIYYLENKSWLDGNTQIEVGDDVIVCGKIMNYGGTLETANKKAYIYSLNGKTKEEGGEPVVIKTVTVAEALNIINELEDGKTTSEEYIVKGYVVTVTEISTQYGNATFTIADEQNGENVLTVFRAKDSEGEKITDENALKAGDQVDVQGRLQKYVKGDVVTPEVASGGKILKINGTVFTGIEEVKTNSRFDGAIYNMAGQRVKTPAKGLFIRNGKKFFVK